MPRSKNSDIDRFDTDASRFDESGTYGTSMNRKNGNSKKEKNLESSAESGSGFPKTDSGSEFPKGDGFHREWHDDSGNADAGPAQVLGPQAKLADDIRDAASSAMRAVKEQASTVASEVGHELGKTAEEGVGRGAEAIRGFAGAIEAAGAELEKVSPQLARYVNDSADKIRTVSQGLSNRQINDLLGSATDFARSQPVLFLGAAVATGFALARFLKSSGQSAQAVAQSTDMNDRDFMDRDPSRLDGSADYTH